MVTKTDPKVETRLVRGEVVSLPHMVERKASKTGKKFNTAALRYWSEDEQDFGIISAAFDLAKAVVDGAVAEGKFVAKVRLDGDFQNLDAIRFLK